MPVALAISTVASARGAEPAALEANFGFADVLQSCVTDFLLSPSWWKDYCNDDSSVKAYFTAANVSSKTIIIPIVNDTLVESTKSFKFRLSNPQGGVQLGTITNWRRVFEGCVEAAAVSNR